MMIAYESSTGGFILNCKIIDVCMRLHNFVVDQHNSESFANLIDSGILDYECRGLCAVNPFVDDIGVLKSVVEKMTFDELREATCPTVAEAHLTEVG